MSVETEQSVTLEESTVEIPPPHRSLEDKVNDILQGKDQPAPEVAPETVPPAEPEELAEKPPLDLKTLAEWLKVDPSELYGLKFKTASGAELTVSEIKDRVQSLSEIENQRDETRKLRAELEADRIRYEREQAALLAAIPKEHVSRELLDTWQKQQTEHLSREREAMLRTIPEWVDSAVVTADRARMVELISEYGFTGSDLENVTDHRLLRLVRDFAKASAKAKAEAKPPPVKVAAAPKKALAASAAMQFGRIKAAVTKGQMSQKAAVDAILSGKV